MTYLDLLPRCWVCGEVVYDEKRDYGDDGYHSPCARQAKRIERGLRLGAHGEVGVRTVRW